MKQTSSFGPLASDLYSRTKGAGRSAGLPRSNFEAATWRELFSPETWQTSKWRTDRVSMAASPSQTLPRRLDLGLELLPNVTPA